MPLKPSCILFALVVPLVSAACTVAGPSATDRSSGQLNGVLASDAPVMFVPVGINDRGCTMYTKKPLREGILVDSAIWYRTADDQFVLDANRCVPDDLAPERERQP